MDSNKTTADTPAKTEEKQEIKNPEKVDQKVRPEEEKKKKKEEKKDDRPVIVEEIIKSNDKVMDASKIVQSVVQTSDKLDLSGGTLSMNPTNSLNIEKPKMDWLFKENIPGLQHEILASPLKKEFYIKTSFSEMFNWSNDRDYIVNLHLKTLEFCVKNYGIFCNQKGRIEKFNRYGQEFQVIPYNDGFNVDELINLFEERPDLKNAVVSRLADNTRMVQRGSKIKLGSVTEFRVYRYQTLTVVPSIYMLDQPELADYLYSPTDINELLKKFDTIYYQINNKRLSKDEFWVLPRQGNRYVLTDMCQSSRFRVWLFNFALSILLKTVTINSTDRTGNYNELGNELQLSSSYMSANNSIPAMISSTHSVNIFYRLVTLCAMSGHCKIMYLPPKQDMRNALSVLGSISYLLIFPNQVLNPYYVNMNLTYLLLQLLRYVKVPKTTTNITTFTFNNKIPPVSVNVLQGLPIVNRDTGNLAGNFDSVNAFIRACGRGPIADVFKYDYSIKNFPPGNNVNQNESFTYPFEQMAGYPDLYIGKIKILMDFCTAISALNFDMTNREAESYKGIFRMIMSRASSMLEYMQKFTMALHTLELLEVTQKREVVSKYELEAKSIEMVAIMIGLDFKNMYIEPTTYETYIYVKSLIFDLTLYSTLTDTVWNNQMFSKFTLPEERRAIINSVLKVTKPWFTLNITETLFELLNREYKPYQHIYRVENLRSYDVIKSNIVRYINIMGWNDTLYFNTDYLPFDNYPGFDYILLSDGNVDPDEELTDVSRVELVKNRLLKPHMRIKYPVPWIKANLKFDPDNKPASNEDKIDILYDFSNFDQSITVDVPVRWKDIKLAFPNLKSHNRIIRILIRNPGIQRLTAATWARGTELTFIEFDKSNIKSSVEVLNVTPAMKLD